MAGGLFMAAWSTYGFETAVCYTREFKDPKRDTFKAIFYAGLLCILVFTLVPLAFQGSLGLGQLVTPAVLDACLELLQQSLERRLRLLRRRWQRQQQKANEPQRMQCPEAWIAMMMYETDNLPLCVFRLRALQALERNIVVDVVGWVVHRVCGGVVVRRKGILIASGNDFPPLQVIEIPSVVLPPAKIEGNRDLLPHLQVIEQVDLVLHKFNVDVLRVLSVLHGDDHFPLGETAPERLRVLDQLDLAR